MRTPSKGSLLVRLAGFVALAGVLLSPLFLTACGKLKARDELNKGVRAFKSGSYEVAVAHFDKAIEADPDLLIARIYRATTFASQFIPGSPTEENKKMGEQAIAGFADVLSRDPKNVPALGYSASLYYGMAGPESDKEKQRELFEKSKDFRRRLIEVEPQNPEHYYSIAVIDWTLCYQRNMQLRANLKLNPDVPLPARDRRQLAEQNTALVEEGIEMLQKALQINPKYLEAMAYLNLIYRQKADLAETPSEREDFLQAADDLVERHKRVREELERKAQQPASPG